MVRPKAHIRKAAAMMLAALVLLAAPPGVARTTNETKPLNAEQLAESDFRQAVSQYRTGEYRSPFQTFRRLAHAGHAEAQYYFGVMYGRGQGVARNWTQAYSWLSCVADGNVPQDLRIDAGRQRALVRRKLDATALKQAQQTARTRCRIAIADARSDKSDGLILTPARSRLMDQLIFSAGDLILMSVVIVAQRADLNAIRNLAIATYKIFGDWFIGLLSVLWWAIFAKALGMALGTANSLRGLRDGGPNVAVARHVAGRKGPANP